MNILREIRNCKKENNVLDQQLLNKNMSGEIQKRKNPEVLAGKGQCFIQIFSPITWHKEGNYLRSSFSDKA